jgi:hypothetical protein
MSTPASSGIDQRAWWVRTLRKIVGPVFSALARQELKKLMPLGARPGQEDRSSFTHLQALANSLQGAAPWLSLRGLSGEEETARLETLDHVRMAVANATDPDSPDLCNFTEGRQVIVDAAVFSLALLRSRESVWNHLSPGVRANVIRCLKATRKQNPPFNNWLLFAATTEAFLCAVGEDWDRMRIDYAIRQHEQWYKGDGMYGDGPFFHFDYYNSFVIQPMLAAVLETASAVTHEWDAFHEPALKRIQRYSQVLERLIAPDGSFPPLGRSLAGRTAAFHALAHTALRQALPPGLPPAQVRCALDAVLRRVFEAGGTFDANGWLRVGFCGSQPSIGEQYVSTGSLYTSTGIFLPLGLPPGDDFWQAPDEEWTQVKVWSGKAFEADHCLIDYDSHILQVR